MNHAAMAVGHDLKFDVVGIDDQFFNVNIAVPESLFRLVPRAMKCAHQTRLIVRGAHAAPASTGRRFDHDRVTDLFRDFDGVLFGIDDAITPGHHRHACFARRSASGILIAH